VIAPRWHACHIGKCSSFRFSAVERRVRAHGPSHHALEPDAEILKLAARVNAVLAIAARIDWHATTFASQGRRAHFSACIAAPAIILPTSRARGKLSHRKNDKISITLVVDVPGDAP
jgi:hypothetical protein